MADRHANIPDRELFKAAEVCEIASVQPYVLRSWEMEFPSIGTSRSPGAPRVYRRADVERILRIKELVFVEGLTLAGARRRIEEEDAPAEGAAAAVVITPEAREKLGRIKNELRGLLTLLDDAQPSKQGGWPPPAQPRLLELKSGEAVKADTPGAPKKAAGGRKKSPRSS